jgi:hypothetical protein
MGLRATQGDEKRLLSSNRSPWKRRPPLCHPERTRISCHAAPDTVTCAPFSKERRIKFANATKFYRKSGAAEGSAVQRTFRGNVFRPSAVESTLATNHRTQKHFALLAKFQATG